MTYPDLPMVADIYCGETACFADEVAFREIRKASGCQPSATWCLGLLLVLFRSRCLSLCVPAPTSYLCLSVSLTLHCSLNFFREPHADSLGHCVNGGHFDSQAPANRQNWAAVLHSLPKHTSIYTRAFRILGLSFQFGGLIWNLQFSCAWLRLFYVESSKDETGMWFLGRTAAFCHEICLEMYQNSGKKC